MTKQAKNILIVCHYYPPHIGGIEMVAQSQAEQLAKRGYGVTVLTSKTSDLKMDSAQNNIKIIRIKAWNILEKFGVPFPFFSPRIMFVLPKLARNADIIHIHDSFYLSSFAAALCGKVYKKPIVLTQHVSKVSHPSRTVMLAQKISYATTGRIVLQLSNRILVLNGRVKKFLIRKGVAKNKIIFMPNGIDTEIFHPADANEKKLLRQKFGLPQEEKIVLFVGRFVPKKGFDKALDACGENYKIVFAGGENFSAHQTKGAIFLGKLDRAQMVDLYRLADIFLLPSRDEGFPLSIQEAMASGLPIITTQEEGYREYNFNENLICFLDNPHGENIRNSINFILQNDEHSKKMSAYSREYACAFFSWSKIMTRLEEIYNEINK